MKDPEIKITIGGLESKGFKTEPFENPERPTDYHKLVVDIALKSEATHSSVYITITDTVFLTKPLLAATVQFMTLFYIQADDYSFLKQPTDEFTINTMIDLVQNAIAHTRPYMLIEGQMNKLGTLTIPYFTHKQLRDLSISSLLAALN